MMTITPTTASLALLLLLTIEHVAIISVHSLSSSSTSTRISSSTVIRGANKYGLNNNSTILSPSDAAIKVGVKPTKDATKAEWQRAWKLHRFLMKPLHLFDNCHPKDSKLSLACLWWKAISGNDVTSCVYDYSLSYDLLPPITRRIVSGRLCRWYPRLHHANVEIRTAYLDKSIVNVINTTLKEDHDDNEQRQQQLHNHQQQQKRRKKIRLIVMGGGYDTRSIKLLEQSLLQSLDIDSDDESGRSDDHYYYHLLRKKYNRHTSNTSQRRTRWYHRLLQRLRRSKIDTNSNNISLKDDTTATIQTTSSTSGNNAFANITSSNYDIQSYELDLPEVVIAKRKLLSKRLYRRRPWLQKFGGSKSRISSSRRGAEEEGGDGNGGEEYPILIEADFNDLNGTRSLLERIVLSRHENESEDATTADDGGDDDGDVTNIIVFEGVMIYLDEGIPHALLEVCSDVLRKSREQQQQQKKKNTSSKSKETPIGYLCFADRLENIPGGDEDAAQLEMESTGWELIDWLSKPGLARHMGVARVADSVVEESYGTESC